jgi:hypothetical protein
MKFKYTAVLLFLASSVSFANDELQAIRDEISALKQHYEAKINNLETRLQAAEQVIKQQSQKIEDTSVSIKQVEDSYGPATSSTANQNSFNPAISLIFDGRYVDYSHKQENVSFPGFALGPEIAPATEGFNIGESELTLSANIDDKFYGEATIAFANDAGETAVEVEELFFQALALNHGLTLKGGRFFSALGYLNQQHAHAWGFADAPLVYQAMLGGQLANDGLQLSVLLPTDLYLEAGLELGNGSSFPSAGNHNGFSSQTLYLKTGGDIGYSHAWQLGLSYWQASVKERSGLDANPDFSYSGDTNIKSLDFVYKWAPNGNNKQQNVKFQFEYFDRDEDGTLGLDNVVDYDGQQQGWYTQVAWLFKPNWRTGIRYDNIDADNNSLNRQRLIDAGLLADGSQTRSSIMLEWLPSEFSRLRIQYNDQIDLINAAQWYFQYTYSMGSHGAHQF